MVLNRLTAACIVVIVLASLTFARSFIYADEITLYSDIVAKSPDKSRPRNNLGHALKEAGRFAEAKVQFERALQLDPNYPDALNNLGTLYNNDGRVEEGTAMIRRALELNPGHVQARSNLAMQYYERGMLDAAEQEYRTLIAVAPYSKEAAFASKMLSMIARSRASGRLQR